MKPNQCFQVGVVSKPHGLKGELYIALDVDYPEDYAQMESVFLLQDGKLVPFFIEYIQLKHTQALLKFEDVDSKDEAVALKGLSVHLPLSFLPDLKDDQFYFHEIVDYLVVDNEKGELGKVVQVFEAGHQDLIGMEYKNKEVLIPINDDIIHKVDREKKQLMVRLPEGLLELYLED